MRVIKFRAWDTAEKRWICKDFHLMGEMMMGGILFDRSIERFNDVLVEQFTGMKDMNGDELYEGDLVRFCEDADPLARPITREVYFDEELLEFGLHDTFQLFHVQFAHEFIRVGNIHENPELLEAKP